MKFIKRAIALLLALALVSGAFICLAADGEKQHYDYDKVLLLGDSLASGYTDYTYKNTEFIRVDDSYAAYVADDLGAELIPMACPGFRTVELRYMLDDTYRPVDRYLFNQIPNSPTHEIIARIPAMRQAIAESDLIIIGIGGNDWGAYLGWVLADIQLENTLPEEYQAALRKFLIDADFDDDIVEKIIELANEFNATDEVLEALPEAVNYAFTSLWANWEVIVEYIYENNPDVVLAVIGMFPATLKTDKDNPDVVLDYDPMALKFEQKIIDFGNKHMIDNQEKYGYIYVDTSGTLVEVSHPTVAGHRHIADRILEEIPDARFQYSKDVSIRNADYKAIEYMTLNGIISGTTADTFSPDDALTKDVLSIALNKITGDYKITDSTDEVSRLNMATAIFKAAEKEDFMGFVDALKLALSIAFSADKDISRADGADILYSFVKDFA